MNEQRVRRLIGLSFILGAILINVPYFILIATFDYPTILREPTAVILSRFQVTDCYSLERIILILRHG